ncbi:hypothetical protein MTO96_033141, partial [Rhipicephalus appendiculatus]
MRPLLPRTRVRPRPTRTAPGRPRPRAQPRLLHPGRSRSPGLVLGPWRNHWNRTLDRSTGTGTWTGTSCPTPVSGTPGQKLEMPSAREEGSLEEPRDPSLQDTSVASADGRAVGKTSMVPVMGGIPEEEPQVQVPAGDEEFQLPVPEEQAPLDEPELVPVSAIAPPEEHAETFAE